MVAPAVYNDFSTKGKSCAAFSEFCIAELRAAGATTAEQQVRAGDAAFVLQ